MTGEVVAGHGFTFSYDEVATWLFQAPGEAGASDDERPVQPSVQSCESLAEVMSWARVHIAKLAGVAFTAVKLDLTIKH